MTHLELHTGDPAEARALCVQLCGWRAEYIRASDREAPYLAFADSNGLTGGLVEQPGRQSLWLPYVEVGSVQRATDRACALGATVISVPRSNAAGVRSVVASAAGAPLALWQPR